MQSAILDLADLPYLTDFDFRKNVLEQTCTSDICNGSISLLTLFIPFHALTVVTPHSVTTHSVQPTRVSTKVHSLRSKRNEFKISISFENNAFVISNTPSHDFWRCNWHLVNYIEIHSRDLWNSGVKGNIHEKGILYICNSFAFNENTFLCLVN